MNLPKLVSEDIPLFLGLIKDLFPGLECTHVGYPDFSAAVKTALSEQGCVVLPTQVSLTL
jgi:dynein heavy chain